MTSLRHQKRDVTNGSDVLKLRFEQLKQPLNKIFHQK